MGDTHKIQFYRVALRRGLGIRKLHCDATEFLCNVYTGNRVAVICKNSVFTIYAEKAEDGYNLYIEKRYHYYRRKK